MAATTRKTENGNTGALRAAFPHHIKTAIARATEPGPASIERQRPAAERGKAAKGHDRSR